MKLKKHWLPISLSAAGLLIALVIIFAVSNTVYPLAFGMHAPVHHEDGVAIGGYDPVAYFTEGVARKGGADLRFNWQGMIWHFAAKEHRELFQQNPQHYAPRFGGYCAFAVSKGFTAAVNPTVWHIQDEELYLFDSEEIKADWLAALGEGIVQDGRANWQ